ncbi:hypothetical protein CPB83DRAFT_857858 [Crepidotus variabilis]|uniref:Uncharacterized protein n=1 Tax=Crepidotus variabilis TaxID=179855 RepID=A0A9P6ECU8_9AGAR|nr:hypothetical protein CPB83DRAFT_857858 [Crepidotus variabilis]
MTREDYWTHHTVSPHTNYSALGTRRMRLHLSIVVSAYTLSTVIPLILPPFYEASATLRGGRLGELGIIRHEKQFREDGFCACTDAF